MGSGLPGAWGSCPKPWVLLGQLLASVTKRPHKHTRRGGDVYSGLTVMEASV